MQSHVLGHVDVLNREWDIQCFRNLKRDVVKRSGLSGPEVEQSRNRTVHKEELNDSCDVLAVYEIPRLFTLATAGVWICIDPNHSLALEIARQLVDNRRHR